MLENALIEFFFVCAQQCSSSQSMEIPAIPGKSGNSGFALASIFALPELYKTLLGHVRPVCEHEGGPTNLSERVEGGPSTLHMTWTFFSFTHVNYDDLSRIS